MIGKVTIAMEIPGPVCIKSAQNLKPASDAEFGPNQVKASCASSPLLLVGQVLGGPGSWRQHRSHVALRYLRGEVTALSHCQRETFFCLLISVSMQIPVAEAPAHLQKCLLLSDVSCQGKAALFIGSQS